MSISMRIGETVPGGDSLREAVIEAGARWSAVQRDLVTLISELDRSGDWAIEGSPTCAHWVAAAVDVEQSTAREWLRVGRALVELQVIDKAFERGDLSYSKVRTLTRVANVDTQAELSELAQRVPASRLRHAVAAWVARHETPEETEARHHDARAFGWNLDVDGMVVATFRLSPAAAVTITGAVDSLVVQKRSAGRDRDASADAPDAVRVRRWPSIAQQRADALLELVNSGGAGIATEIVMHVRADGCTLDDGTSISGSIIERLAPSAFLRALIHDAESRPINASGRQRHPTSRQRRVVKARDEACVDCGSTQFLEYDHQPDFEQTRRTIVDEVRLRCWTCHRSRHRRNGRSQA